MTISNPVTTSSSLWFRFSYTSFAYSDPEAEFNTLTATGKLTVTITVKILGSRDGKHAVELYTHDLYASIIPSVAQVAGFPNWT